MVSATLGTVGRLCCDVTRLGRDDECANAVFFLKRMTIVCRQRSIRRKICLRDQSQLQKRRSKPTTAVHPASITGSEIGARSVIPIPIFFDAFVVRSW